jgi:trehalose 6-phosphate synthase/phosphatase
MYRRIDNEVFKTFKKAVKRLLFLDYDGTLVPFHDLPEDSKLSETVKNLLISMSKGNRNQIYIISGRDKEFLDKQFNGLNVGLIAEHGFALKENNGDWVEPFSINGIWKGDVKNLFSEFTKMFPRSFIEEKESSIAYHYRTAGKEAEIKARPAIRDNFTRIKEMYPGLELLDGDNVIEIKPDNYNKGRVAADIIRKGNFDFILAAGDDITDERLFSGLPKEAFTIKIGCFPSSARYFIPTQKEFVQFLSELQGEGYF